MILAGLLTGVFLFALSVAPGFAQCPMCGKSAEYAGTSPGSATRTLAAAAIVLLAPTIGILGGFGALLWRQRERKSGKPGSAINEHEPGHRPSDRP